MVAPMVEGHEDTERSFAMNVKGIFFSALVLGVLAFACASVQAGGINVGIGIGLPLYHHPHPYYYPYPYPYRMYVGPAPYYYAPRRTITRLRRYTTNRPLCMHNRLRCMRSRRRCMPSRARVICRRRRLLSRASRASRHIKLRRHRRILPCSLCNSLPDSNICPSRPPSRQARIYN